MIKRSVVVSRVQLLLSLFVPFFHYFNLLLPSLGTVWAEYNISSILYLVAGWNAKRTFAIFFPTNRNAKDLFTMKSWFWIFSDLLPVGDSRFTIIEGGDANVPDEKSLQAARIISDLARSLTADDLLITLLSGTRHLSQIVCHRLSVIGCLLQAVCYKLSVTVDPVTGCMSPVT